jgi:threonyl-tRNA synthetase
MLLQVMLNMVQIVFNSTHQKEELKPMNCPHHCEIYNVRPWSYKDLPNVMLNLELYTDTKSGELHGLTRVRGFYSR